MIIGRGKKEDGSEFLILGLSEENMRRLPTQPIVLKRSTHGDGVPEGWEITIISGSTEYEMKLQLELAGLVTKDTPTFIDPRLEKP